MDISIRAPRVDELELLRECERSAGALFARIGLDDIAAAEPASVATLDTYRRAGRLWLIALDGQPVGSAYVDIVDGLAHLAEISVRSDRGGRGLGAALLTHICGWAAGNGYEAMTLTTFTDVAWNAPFYAKHGFRVLTEDEIGPELRDLCAHEAALGLDPATRVCMRRDLDCT